MSTLTKNFNLIKPDLSDNVSPSQYNDNFDRIDELLNERTKDYIVDQGVYGIWTYRKWNSGIAECWGHYNYSVNVNSANGSLYSTWCDLPNLPFTFKTLQSRSLTEGQQSRYAHWICGDSIGTASVSSAGKCYIYSTTKGTMGGSISIEIKGTWK